MVHPVLRIGMAGALAGAVMIGAVLVDASREKMPPARSDAIASSTAAKAIAPHLDPAPSAPLATPAAEITTQGPTDEEILALVEANPELRASIDELLNDPDPAVRKEGAALMLELAAAVAETSSARTAD